MSSSAPRTASPSRQAATRPSSPTRDLRRFTAVVFLNTTAEVMTPVGSSPRCAGSSSTAGDEQEDPAPPRTRSTDWPFYTRLLTQVEHPGAPAGAARRDPARVGEAPLDEAPAPAVRIPLEEFYSLRPTLEPAKVLLSVDESTYLQDPNASPPAIQDEAEN